MESEPPCRRMAQWVETVGWLSSPMLKSSSSLPYLHFSWYLRSYPYCSSVVLCSLGLGEVTSPAEGIIVPDIRRCVQS